MRNPLLQTSLQAVSVVCVWLSMPQVRVIGTGQTRSVLAVHCCWHSPRVKRTSGHEGCNVMPVKA